MTLANVRDAIEARVDYAFPKIGMVPVFMHGDRPNRPDHVLWGIAQIEFEGDAEAMTIGSDGIDALPGTLTVTMHKLEGTGEAELYEQLDRFRAAFSRWHDPDLLSFDPVGGPREADTEDEEPGHQSLSCEANFTAYIRRIL